MKIFLKWPKRPLLAANKAVREMLWMKQFLQDLDLKEDVYVVNCDSQSELDLSKNAPYHSQTQCIVVLI